MKFFGLTGLGPLAALAMAAAPAVADSPDEDKAADARLGARVDRICFGRNINNFKAIEGEDDAVLLEKGVNDWYKATLVGACNYRELRWAEAVVIDQRPSGGCVTPGDYLVFSRSAFGDFSFPNTTRCAISEIYEWNPDAADDDAAS